MPRSARLGKSCHPCPRGGCAPVLAASPRSGGKNTSALPGDGQTPRTSSDLPAARHPASLKTTAARSGRARPCPAQGKGLPAAAPRHGLPWDNVTSRARRAGALRASKQERFIGRRPHKEWPRSHPPLPLKQLIRSGDTGM